MQPKYLHLLGDAVKQFVLEVEQDCGMPIDVFEESSLNNTGPLGKGRLEVSIEPYRLRIFAPTNGYFPEGAVRHEVLHIHRFYVEGVPKLVLRNQTRDNRDLAENFTDIDNALEHLVIIPLELQLNPERLEHWDAMATEICRDLEEIPEDARKLAVCMNWTFLSHVLPNSPQTSVMRHFALRHGLLTLAEDFSARLVAVLARKEEMLRVLAQAFPEIGKDGGMEDVRRPGYQGPRH